MNSQRKEHGADQFKPNTTVAAVIHSQNKFLLVEEVENGKHVYNQPAGHIEESESIINAVKREITEETGLVLTPDFISGIYYYHRPELQLYYLRFCFVIELPEQLQSKPQDDEIIATHWLSYDEIIARKNQLRSPLVLDCINDYLSGNKIPLSSLKTNL